MSLRNKLNYLEKNNIIDMYVSLHEKLKNMCPLDGMTENVLNIVLKYVQPCELNNFFLKYGLNRNIKFKLDMCNSNNFINYKVEDWDVNGDDGWGISVDMNIVYELIDMFPNMKVTSLEIQGYAFEIPHELYDVSKLKIVCECGCNLEKCWFNSKISFEKFVNLKHLSVHCHNADNLDMLKMCRELCSIVVDVSNCKNYDFLGCMSDLNRVVVIGAKKCSLDVLRKCEKMRYLSLVKCNVLNIVDVISGCRNLEYLILNYVDFTTRDRFAKRKLRCNKLKYLSLVFQYDSNVSDEVADLHNCHNLRRVDICSADSVFMMGLRFGKHVKNVHFNDCYVSNLDMLAKCTMLRHFRAKCCELINIDGLSECGNLHDVRFYCCEELCSVDALSKCTKLCKFIAYNCDRLCVNDLNVKNMIVKECGHYIN